MDARAEYRRLAEAAERAIKYISLETDRARLAESARMWRAKAEACHGEDCAPLVTRESRSWRG
jgi:hypothetical protein